MLYRFYFGVHFNLRQVLVSCMGYDVFFFKIRRNVWSVDSVCAVCWLLDWIINISFSNIECSNLYQEFFHGVV